MRLNPVLAVVVLGLSVNTVFAQTYVTRDIKFGEGRITELVPLSPAGSTATASAGGVIPAGGRIAADNAPPAIVRDATKDGYRDLSTAIRSLNPSYAISPVVAPWANSAGSYYLRVPATPIPVGDPPRIYMLTPWMNLPAPSYLGWRNGHHNYPWWLYSGTVQPVLPAGARDKELSDLREEVQRLRKKVEELSKPAGGAPKAK